MKLVVVATMVAIADATTDVDLAMAEFVVCSDVFAVVSQAEAAADAIQTADAILVVAADSLVLVAVAMVAMQQVLLTRLLQASQSWKVSHEKQLHKQFLLKTLLLSK